MITLPAPCPLCDTLLQRHNQNPDRGVAPHYETCHPGATPPTVQS